MKDNNLPNLNFFDGAKRKQFWQIVCGDAKKEVILGILEDLARTFGDVRQGSFTFSS